MHENLGFSIRKAFLLVDLLTSVYLSQPKTRNYDTVRERLCELAEQRRRFGSPRIYILLKRERLVINHKRFERLYREKGLVLREKRRIKGAAGSRVGIPFPKNRNERWAIGFSFMTVLLPGVGSGH